MSAFDPFRTLWTEIFSNHMQTKAAYEAIQRYMKSVTSPLHISTADTRWLKAVAALR